MSRYPSLWNWIINPTGAAVGAAVQGGQDAIAARRAVERGEQPPDPPPGVSPLEWYTAVLGSQEAAAGYIAMVQQGAAGAGASLGGVPNAAWGGIGLQTSGGAGPWDKIADALVGAGRIVVVGGALVGVGYVTIEVAKAIGGRKR